MKLQKADEKEGTMRENTIWQWREIIKFVFSLEATDGPANETGFPVCRPCQNCETVLGTVKLLFWVVVALLITVAAAQL